MNDGCVFECVCIYVFNVSVRDVLSFSCLSFFFGRREVEYGGFGHVGMASLSGHEVDDVAVGEGATCSVGVKFGRGGGLACLVFYVSVCVHVCFGMGERRACVS